MRICIVKLSIVSSIYGYSQRGDACVHNLPLTWIYKVNSALALDPTQFYK